MANDYQLQVKELTQYIEFENKDKFIQWKGRLEEITSTSYVIGEPSVNEYSIPSYCNKLASPGVWGTQVELVATATLTGKPVYVLMNSSRQIQWEVFQAVTKTENLRMTMEEPFGAVGKLPYEKRSNEQFGQGTSKHNSTDQMKNVEIYPMLLTFNGLPNSKSSTALNKLVPQFNRDNPLGFSNDQFVVHSFRNDCEMRFEEITDFSLESLKSGDGLMNIWDIGVSRAIIPALYRFSGHYSLNYMWLFIDLDHDLHNLHIPPEVSDSKVMKWRSRVQVLFRSCHLSKGHNKEGVCKIFATYADNHNVEQRLAILKRECSNVAKQMGVEELVNGEIKAIDIGSSEAVQILRTEMQKVFQQIEPQHIPKTWMSLRSSLAKLDSVYITTQELKQKADKYEIAEESLHKFCKLFASFGSILDVQLIDSQSEYVIIKPFEFTRQLQSFFDHVKERSKVADTGIINDKETAFMKILRSLSLAARVPPHKTISCDGVTIPGPAFYIPSFRTGEVVMKCTPGAIQLVIGMESSPMNLHVKIIDYLLHQLENAQLILTQDINRVRISTPEDPFEIEITSQGDVIEIVSCGEERYGEMYRKVCKMIVTACDTISETMQPKNIKYHFAVTCELDRYKNIGYNIYHRRHVLPSKHYCKKCDVKGTQVGIWNELLNEIPIKPDLKLNGSLALQEILDLAKQISCFHRDAIDMFAQQLDVDIPNMLVERAIVGRIINFSEKYEAENDESSKKALARKLITLDEFWQEKIKNNKLLRTATAPFRLCARQLDIQVYAENQLVFIVPTDEITELRSKVKALENQLRHRDTKISELEEVNTQLCSPQKSVEELSTGNQDHENVTHKVIQCIRDEIQSNYGYLSAIFQPSIKEIGAQMVQVGILPLTAGQNPAFETIISIFLTMVANTNKLQEIKEKCEKFFSTFYNMGGPFVEAADNVKEKIRKSVKEKVGIVLNI